MSLTSNDVPRNGAGMPSLSEAIGQVIVQIPGLVREAGKVVVAREAAKEALPVAERTRDQITLVALVLGGLFIMFVLAK